MTRTNRSAVCHTARNAGCDGTIDASIDYIILRWARVAAHTASRSSAIDRQSARHSVAYIVRMPEIDYNSITY